MEDHHNNNHSDASREPTNISWQQMGQFLEDEVNTYNRRPNKKHTIDYVMEAYKHILSNVQQVCDSKCWHPESSCFPFMNPVHVLLYCKHRSIENVGTQSRKILGEMIMILRIIEKLGWLKEGVSVGIPSVDQIIGYDKILPRLRAVDHKVMIPTKRKKDHKRNQRSRDEQFEDGNNESIPIIATHLDANDDIKEYAFEPTDYDYRLGTYGDFVYIPTIVKCIPPEYYFVQMMMLHGFTKHMDLEFGSGPVNPNTPVIRFNQCEYVRRHAQYDKSTFIHQLNNGTLLSEYIIIVASGKLYYIREMNTKWRAETKLTGILTRCQVQQCKSSINRDFFRPIVVLRVDEIDYHDDFFCIIEQDLYMEVTSNSRVALLTEDPIEVARIQYIRNDDDVVRRLRQPVNLPQKQHQDVVNNKMYIFGVLGFDGLPINMMQNTIDNTFYTFANHKYSSTNQNVCRLAVTDKKKVPQRVIMKVILQHLHSLKTKPRQLWVATGPTTFTHQTINSSFLFQSDNAATKAMLNHAMTVGSNSRWGGKTYIDMKQNGMQWPPDDCAPHIRTMHQMISSDWKIKMHRKVHTIVAQRMRDGNGTVYPGGFGSYTFGVSNEPFQQFYSLNQQRIDFNASICVIPDPHHTISSGPTTSIFEAMTPHFYYQNLSKYHTAFVEHILSYNSVLKKYQ
eukprot:1014991_1